MSAQISKVDSLVMQIKRQREDDNAADEIRYQNAKAAKKAQLADYIEEKLVNVLPILGINSGDFEYIDLYDGWSARIDWQQELNGQSYPITITANEPYIIISSQSGTEAVAKKILAPSVPDPVYAIGEFLTDLPRGWENLQIENAARTLKRLRQRIDNATDLDALLAVAAAADTNEALFDDHRRALRKEVAWGIRTIRNQERTARAQRNADLSYAGQIIELAQAYLHEDALYHNRCFDWAVEWTRELWEPSELYRLRYVPVTADGNTEHCIQEIVVLDHPSTLDVGDWNHAVTEVTTDGRTRKLWIGAFLDARPVRYEKPQISMGLIYHRSVRAGYYYVNVPADDLSPVDLAAVEAARPEPPVRWYDWLQEHYTGDRPICLPVIDYDGYIKRAHPDELARMTPAEFIDEHDLTNL